MWSMAFQTTDTTDMLDDVTGGEHINVFVPATPNITSGFLMMVHKSQVKSVNLTVEEGLKLIVSLGVVQPGVATSTKTSEPSEPVTVNNELNNK